ncbi:hypothetical protein ATZ33_01380 [Enterococcus silesiacus]|uniref:Uncharacterized protein n=2 Tax=Enterococcus silesiacus TaxID=332949 RepID=A0ABN4J2I6_9ENTE|nr:hypothetical protein [Enterococcus silesiacus]ALS00081.1 hypothetical protein ATZ33_01380 [Enterococcus silesiacus]
MITLLTLNLADDKYLQINSENNGEKRYFHDETTIKYLDSKREIILFKDSLHEGLESLKNMLLLSLNNELPVSEKTFLTGVGYEWNIYYHNLDEFSEEDPTELYSLWSVSPEIGSASWIYNRNSQIFFEISPQYLWDFIDSNVNEEQTTFEEFMESYTFDAQFSLDRKVCMEMVKILEGLLSTVEL